MLYGEDAYYEFDFSVCDNSDVVDDFIFTDDSGVDTTVVIGETNYQLTHDFGLNTLYQ